MSSENGMIAVNVRGPCSRRLSSKSKALRGETQSINGFEQRGRNGLDRCEIEIFETHPGDQFSHSRRQTLVNWDLGTRHELIRFNIWTVEAKQARSAANAHVFFTCEAKLGAFMVARHLVGKEEVTAFFAAASTGTP
jgi:hypothetical protein